MSKGIFFTFVTAAVPNLYKLARLTSLDAHDSRQTLSFPGIPVPVDVAQHQIALTGLSF